MKFKTIAMTGVMSLAGLGLIGAGAHAVFTTTTASSQQINAGVPGMAMWASNATNGCVSQAAAEAYPATCQFVTLTAATVGSTFDAASDIGVVNTGDIPVSLTSFTVSDTGGGGANYYLEQQMGLCIDGIYNGSLPAAFGTTPLGTPVSLALLATTTYGVDLYAGEAPTYCGHGDVVSTPLASDASGGSDTVTITANYTG